MVDVFFLKLKIDNLKKYFSCGFSQGKNWKEGRIFHLTVEMKQPYTIEHYYIK